MRFFLGAEFSGKSGVFIMVEVSPP